jgi:glycerol-3-phosphate dehydrogenase (NAD(P)+)
MNIAFIGLGKFGQAIASLVIHNGHEYEYAEVDRLLTKPADMVFVTVPAQFIRPACAANAECIPKEAIIVNCTKGIEEKTHLFAHEIIQSVGPFPNYYSLIGPSFASGIIDQDPTVVSLGYADSKHVATVKKVLQTPYFRVQETAGYEALELSSALKNLYAITCGYATGLGHGPNTTAQLITLALNEFTQMAKALKLKEYDPMAPGVVGDMLMTCSSKESRNFQYGLSLAVAAKTGEEPTAMQHTVEGYFTSHSIQAIAKKHGATLPLAFLTHDIIQDPPQSEVAFRTFLARS